MIEGYKKNPGRCPPEARGKKVHAVWKNGQPAKGNYPADGNGGLKWHLTGHEYNIGWYKVVED